MKSKQFIKRMLLLLFMLLMVAIPSKQTEIYAAQTSESVDAGDDTDHFYEAPKLNVSSLHLIAGGDAYQLELEHAIDAEYTISQGDVSSIVLSEQTAESVTITPVQSGQATLSVTATGADQQKFILNCQIQVSALSLQKQNVDIYLNDSNPRTQIAICGAELDAVYYGHGDKLDATMRNAMDYDSQCSISVKDRSVADAAFYNGSVLILGNAKGNTTVDVNIYGKTLSLNIKVLHFTLNKYTINTYKGSEKKNIAAKRRRWPKSILEIF